MWAFQSESLADSGLRATVQFDSGPASFADVIGAWRSDPVFRAEFNDWLAEAPYPAFRWETPSVTTATITRSFEFVLLDTPGLAPHPDPDAFAEHFQDPSNDGVVEFKNLGGDATLIVPLPLAPASAYGHLASFVREAPAQQRDTLWRLVGDAMTRRLGRKPVWLSTAGAGVSWLHVRLDARPKYYHFKPYCQIQP